MRRVAASCALAGLLGTACTGSLALESEPSTPTAAAASALAAAGVLGVWRMDDCASNSRKLKDSSGAAADAQRSSGVTCSPGFSGQAVVFDERRDRVEATGSGFALREAATLAARLKPDSTREGVLVAKRNTNRERDVVALSLNRGTVVFDVQVGSRRASVRSRNRVSSGEWTQVVGSFDGQNLRIFVNGSEAGSTAAAGTISDASGPVRMGENFRGALDDIVLASSALTPADIDDIAGSGDNPTDPPPPAECVVHTDQELMIRDLSVVEDPVRSVYSRDSRDRNSGIWAFGYLMEQMAARPEDAPKMVEDMFRTWLTDQTINGFTIPARPTVQQEVLDNWPRVGAELDLTQAPFRLLAIVNRVDLRNLDDGVAGEGRFVFGLVGADPTVAPQFTLILEYRLPASTEEDVLDWARRWHALGELPFPSEAFNAALQAVTTRFAGRRAEPGRPNGSALRQLRTNEIDLARPWELREFALTTSGLQPTTVKQTPATSFRDNNPALAAFVNANESAILVERHTVPESFEGMSFLGGSAFTESNNAWQATGINNNEARHKFALNTCNGCHSRIETNTSFTMIKPRRAGEASTLSTFLTGGSVIDPVDNSVQRTFNDLQRRMDDLEFLVCGERVDSLAPTTASVARGIGRVH